MEPKNLIESAIFISFFLLVFCILLVIYNFVAPEPRVFMQPNMVGGMNNLLNSFNFSELTIEHL
jgi:hypothetical protein